MMKRLISLVLCAVLLLGCMTFAHAQVQRNDNVAVDIVLLIDQSGSVWNGGNSGASDPDGLRLDAAQMVIAMLGNNGSRVAYVPFGSQIFANADSSFHKIESEDDYIRKMKECERLRDNPGGPNGENGGGTDFAEPLAYAYNLLAKRGPQETNQPMIILLTDGMMEFTKDGNGYARKSKPFYQWSNSKNCFEFIENGKPVLVYSSKGHSGTYFTEDLLDEATDRCRMSEYPVYTVALAADPNAEHYRTLQQISNDTRGTSIAISRGDNEGLRKLPEYFGAMFANRIGTSELKPLTVKAVPGKENAYMVEFVIPNESVMEANIFFPTEGLADYKILDDNDKEPGKSLQALSSKHFVLYKLVNPRPFGIWKLYFTKTDSNVADISFNLLYNYNVVLHGDVRETNNEWNPEGLTFARGDKLEFRTRFFDSKANNGQGSYKTDERLYNYPDDPTSTADDWCAMNANWTLYRQVDANNSELIKSGKMEADGASFYTSMDMKTIKPDAHGKNGLMAGDYYLVVHVEGSGLIREVEIPFTLTNTLPSAGIGSIDLTQMVDQQPGDEVKTFNLAAYIRDEDGDRLSSNFVQTSGKDIARLEYDSEAQVLTSTVLADAEGKHHWGTVEGELRVIEDSTSVVTTLPITLNISSNNNELTQRWTLKATADGKTADAVVEKDTEFGIKLELRNNNQNGALESDDSLLESVTAKIRIVAEDYTQVISDREMPLNADENIFTFDYKTGLNEGVWTVEIELRQKDTNLFINKATTNFKVVNHAPKATPTVAGEPEQLTINFNPLPEFLSFLGTASTVQERTLDMNAYFAEQDRETLRFTTTEDVDGALLKINSDGAIWMLQQADDVRYLETVVFDVIAYDNDGAASDTAVQFEIHLVNLTDLWIHRSLMALAALVAFIILVSIIRQIRKPKFPRATLGVREGNSDYDTSSYDLMPSKKPISLAAVVMTDTAAKFGISANALTNILLVPVRSLNGSIGVRLAKRMDDVSVSLTTKGVGKGKKPAVWAPGDTLILNSRNNTTGSELNILLYPPETNVPGAMAEESGPFQLGDDSGFSGFNSDVNAFGANDVSGSFGGFAPTDSFSTSSSSDNGFGASSSDDSTGFGAGFQAEEEKKDDFIGGF